MCFLTFTALVLRYLYIQNEIRNAQIEITEFSESGYTPPGVYGHGDLVSNNGQFGWYIYDINDPENGVRKACIEGVKPQSDWDVDFIYSKGAWYKLRSGLGVLSEDGFLADPPTQDWHGIPTKLAFPVRKPDLPYRAKILVSKLKDGTQSPLDYLQMLKASNPSCANIPTP